MNPKLRSGGGGDHWFKYMSYVLYILKYYILVSNLLLMLIVKLLF